MSAEIAAGVLAVIGWTVLAYFAVVNAFQTALLTSAAVGLRRHRLQVWEEGRIRLLGSETAPTISVLAPAHNEEASVAESVHALLTLHYPALEVVLVNDGSTDATLEVLIRTFDLVPIHPIFDNRVPTKPVRGLYRSRMYTELLVVDKDNGGKADALNAGLNCATGQLVCAIDADTIIEPDALLRIVRPFLARADVVAAGGTIRVANGSQVRGGRVVDARAPRRLLAGCQAVEYLRAFLFGRLGWNYLGGNLIISGAFGLFRRDAMLDVGGYVHDTVGEDMELVADLRRRGRANGTASRVEFVPDPVAWTEVPETLRTLGRQRDRWHRGLADVLRRHRRLCANPRYGGLGLVVYPYYLVVELLGPVVEALGLVAVVAGLALGAVDGAFAALFVAVAYGWGLVVNITALLLEELSFRRYRRWSDLFVLLAWSVVEGIAYRQLTVAWRLRGLWRYLQGRTEWGAMSRRGFGSPLEGSTS
ncbi:MAG: glycosyltransferase [Nitriliruptorales bacterium]|nr:glycosyltransferase [Nitriliruptorales bacterium]